MTVADLCQEFCGCDFGDERLQKRIGKLAQSLGQQPNITIPAALKTKADIEACYEWRCPRRFCVIRLDFLATGAALRGAVHHASKIKKFFASLRFSSLV